MENLVMPLEGEMGENLPYFKAYFQERMPGEEEDYRLPAIIICPGGGFTHLSVREAEPVALNFLAKGYQVFVLYYSIKPRRYPQAVLDAAKTIANIRSHAREWHVDSDKVAILGFSAGGHVAAALSTLANHPAILESGYTEKQIRPNAAVLCYSVIASLADMSKEYKEKYDSMLLGEDVNDAKMRELAAIYNHVSEKNPPTFLWHTAEDKTVLVEHSLAMAAALSRKKVPFELHVFPKGRHGLALATQRTCNGDKSMIIPEAAQWVELCCDWLARTL